MTAAWLLDDEYCRGLMMHTPGAMIKAVEVACHVSGVGITIHF